MDNEKEKKRILIVDDDPGLLKTVEYILDWAGYDILTAETGEEGLAIAGREKLDLIILDVLLPGIKGREVCKELKDAPGTRDIPVIFLTSKDSCDDIEAEMELGAVEHITKPVNPTSLKSIVKGILND